MAVESDVLFSPEDLSEQMAAIELLSAMWSADGELVLSEQDEKAVHAVGEYLNLPVASLGDSASQKLKASIPTAIELTLVITPDPQQSAAKLGLVVSIPLRRPEREQPTSDRDRRAALRVSSSHGLSRSTTDELNALLSNLNTQEGDEDADLVSQVMTAVEQLSEHVLTLPSMEGSIDEKHLPLVSQNSGESAAVRRSWFYLPSLSSRDKREDIVHAATTFDPPLSGFLIAGKPGLIVLEHPLYSQDETQLAAQSTKAAHALDRFWSDIKSHSWGDIPSSHKKISEKLTEPICVKGAAFSGFHDITNWPETERAPDRGRKTDLSKLVTWLESRGIDGKASLERCLGVGWA